MESISNKIIAKISSITNHNSVLPHNELENDLGMDSLGFIRLLVEIEHDYHIKIEETYLDIGMFPTVKSVCEFVENLYVSTQDNL